MADTGWHNPSGIDIVTAYGTHDWLTPDNAKLSNNAYAYAIGGVSGGITHYLRGYSFAMAVPAGATIDGIYVRIEKRSGVDGTKDQRVRIVKGGFTGATDRSNANFWPTSDGFVYHGSSSDKWGETWTVADINHAWFGVVISANIWEGRKRAYIDVLQIKVYYTVPSTNMKINIGDVWKDVSEIKINVGDVWKTVTEVWINIGDVWKKIFG